VQIAPGMDNARHLYVLVFSQGYWSVHSMPGAMFAGNGYAGFSSRGTGSS
jgi:hypothetical protein